MTITIPIWVAWVVGGVVTAAILVGIGVVIALAILGKGLLDGVGRGLNW